jgi:hypothetical protein
MKTHNSKIKFLGMFAHQLPIKGDDALLELARARLTEVNCGGEVYPLNPAHLQKLLKFLPDVDFNTTHLMRELNILRSEDRDLIITMAEICKESVSGMIIHDYKEFKHNPAQTISAIDELNKKLLNIPNSPMLFIEFGGSLSIEEYTDFIASIAPFERISACIDVGHVGMKACRTYYEENYGHPIADLKGPSIVSLKDRLKADIKADRLDYPKADLKGHPITSTQKEAVSKSMATSLPAVIKMLKDVGKHGKPLHIHLHEGHPLSTLSCWGVSDHLDFQTMISIQEKNGNAFLEPGIFGISGMADIIRTLSADAMPSVSVMIEIHPQPGAIPLGRYANIFSHWKDTFHAEQMNFWIDRIITTLLLARSF